MEISLVKFLVYSISLDDSCSIRLVPMSFVAFVKES